MVDNKLTKLKRSILYVLPGIVNLATKTDIGKSFDKSIYIDKLILNDIDFIGQLIKIDTRTPMEC